MKITTKICLVAIVLSFITFNAVAQNVYIPDANFKAYLLGNSSINTNLDSEIQTSEAAAYSGTINVYGSNIVNLTGIEAFTALISLNCQSNQISNLDVSAITTLKSLTCGFNQLTNLDVSANIALNSLSCRHNFLTILNIRNGNNGNFLTFQATNNPNLPCIKVDDAAYMNTYWASAKDAGASYDENCNACNVTIPDANFKAKLVNNPSINTNNDTEIQCSEAAAFTDTMNVGVSFIADLTGIEAFTALTVLYCFGNELTNLDVSSNTEITTLYCGGNQLTSLDFSSNTALTYLDCQNNYLTNLNVSANTVLTYLDCETNPLTSLNVSSDTALTYLQCSFNQLSSLDVSTNKALTYLYCQNNNLADFNMRNGNNNRLLGYGVRFNTPLTCIQVDDAAYMNANWAGGWIKDAWAYYSEDCAVGTNEISNTDVSIYPNPTNDMLNIILDTTNELVKYTVLTIDGKIVVEGKTTENTIKIDLQNNSNGIYILKINGENTNKTFKVIKE